MWRANQNTYQFGLSAVFLCILILFLLGVHPPFNTPRHTDEDPGSRQSSKTPASSAKAPADTNTWTFNTRRDAENYGLSDEQCTAAFPKLYTDIEHMKSKFQNRRISKADIDAVSHGWSIRLMIYEGQLYVIGGLGLHRPMTRGMASLHSINQALIAYPARRSLPNIEAVLYTDDDASIEGPGPLWTYTKNAAEPKFDEMWLAPDFGFYAWPEPKIGTYDEVRRKIADVEHGLPFEEKKRQLVWRGRWGNQFRRDFLNVTEGKKWAAVRSVRWKSSKSLKKDLLSMPDHCKYQMVMHITGNTWSGQGKYMHNCESVWITNEGSRGWREIYDSALEASGPEQNYVSVKDDWSDLESTVRDLLDNPQKGKAIAQQSASVLRDRYLTPAAIACYWRKLIRAWGEVSFEPEFYGKDRESWRGVPFGSVALLGETEWEAS